MAVFYHEAHRAFLDLGVIKMHEHRGGAIARAAIGNFDLQHGLGLVSHGFPKAEPRQQTLRGQRQSIRASVKGGVFADLGL